MELPRSNSDFEMCEEIQSKSGKYIYQIIELLKYFNYFLFCTAGGQENEYFDSISQFKTQILYISGNG